MQTLIPLQALKNVLDSIFQEEGQVIFHLGQSSTGFNIATRLIDFTESSYIGYAPFTITPPLAYPYPPDENAVCGPTVFAFNPPVNPADSGYIDGWYATYENELGGAQQLLCCQEFDNQVRIPDDTVTLAFALFWRARQENDFGADSFALSQTSFNFVADPTGSGNQFVAVQAMDVNGFPARNYQGSATFSCSSVSGNASVGANGTLAQLVVTSWVDGAALLQFGVGEPSPTVNDTITFIFDDGVALGQLVSPGWDAF
jgi:hypothetical protein